jgi:hypothetical protein
MKKYNCWELLQCGREEGGRKVAELGICAATQAGKGDGINDGIHRGRICWAVAGTICGEKVQGVFAQKRETCRMCPVYLLVKEEESERFQELLPGQKLEE